MLTNNRYGFRNRVFKDKTNGLIVDYVGIFRSLEKALSIWAAPGGGKTDMPIKDKAELKDLLIEAINETKEFLKKLRVNLDRIRQTKDILVNMLHRRYFHQIFF